MYLHKLLINNLIKLYNIFYRGRPGVGRGGLGRAKRLIMPQVAGSSKGVDTLFFVGAPNDYNWLTFWVGTVGALASL